ncbi:MAG: hypothetical protein LC798_13750 [Chloroflexi bacterium]|nr:hypothetical protein [Chloroflexota bacterium]
MPSTGEIITLLGTLLAGGGITGALALWYRGAADKQSIIVASAEKALAIQVAINDTLTVEVERLAKQNAALRELLRNGGNR